MARTIIAVFESVYSAKEAVWELVDLGFPRRLVELVAESPLGNGNSLAKPEKPRSEIVMSDLRAGAVIGAGIGASLGLFSALVGSQGAIRIAPLLTGIGAWMDGLSGTANGKMASIAFPHITPILAALANGPFAAAFLLLAAVLFFAFAGSLASGLVGLGIPEEEIRQYAKNVRAGTVTVMIVADGDAIDGSLKVLGRHNPLEIKQKPIEWHKAGPREKRLAERALHVKVTEEDRPR